MGVYGKSLLGLLDANSLAASYARLAHPAGNHRRVARHSAPGGQDAHGSFHSVDVIRDGFGAHQDDGDPVAAGSGFVGGEHCLAHGCARGGRQALGGHFQWLRLINQRVKELVKLSWFHPQQSLPRLDQLFLHHVIGHLQGGAAGPLARTGLQHIELAVLDGVFEVLHVAIVALQALGNRP